MKKVSDSSILNVTTDNDNKFLFEYLTWWENNNIKTIFISDLLEKRINTDMLEKTKNKPAIYSNVYSPKDELEIFKEIFDNALFNNEKIHIVWVTLKEELDIIEGYYNKLWFRREDINCYEVDFRIPLVTVSVKIENLMWKWSDYKRMWKKIFFNPPIRESGEVKAMFKWINKWIVANIYLDNIKDEYHNFLTQCIIDEQILAIPLAKLLKYNLESIWFKWVKKDLIIQYS